MKKNIFTPPPLTGKIIVLLFVMLAIFNSCEENDMKVKPEFKSITNLKSDARFVSYVEDNTAMLEGISDKEKAKKLFSKSTLTSQESEELAKALGFNNFAEYSTFVLDQDKKLIEIHQEYDLSKANESIIQESVIEIASKRYDRINNNGLKQAPPGSGSGDCNCERMRINCIGIATTASIGGQIACLSLDLTVIGGIICHGAVYAAQIFAMDNCNAEAENCVANCKTSGNQS